MPWQCKEARPLQIFFVEIFDNLVKKTRLELAIQGLVALENDVYKERNK